jgi:hypothetical protein
VIGIFFLGLLPSLAGGALPAFDHVVVVVEENHSYTEVIGNPDAPYINSLAGQDALFTNSFAIEHPSQPNYLDLFSGSNQGITDNEIPPGLFTTLNLGAALIAKGLTFGGYSESLPSIGFAGASSPDGFYMRRHNAWVNWQDSGLNAIPAASNLRFSDLPTDSDGLVCRSKSPRRHARRLRRHWRLLADVTPGRLRPMGKAKQEPADRDLGRR